MRSSDLRSARLGAVAVCLMAVLMPLSSVEAQVIGKPGLRQPAVPDLVSLILYVPPINLGGGPPSPGPQGGREAEGAVILSGNAPAGGAVITLSSRNTALLHVPATVTVPAGASSVKFRYDPLPVTEPTTVMASAVYSGQTRTASVLILPPPLVALTLDSLQLQGGNKTTGLVKLDGVGPTDKDLLAPGVPSDKDIRVVLSSNHPAVQVPGEVLLRGVPEKSFQVTTKGVGQPTAVIVSASFAGRTRQASLTVLSARLSILGGYQINGPNTNWFSTVNCHPQGQSGNLVYSGKIPLGAKLTGPAPFDAGAVIKITSSNPQLLPVPATLSIAPNAIQAETQLTCPSPAVESIVIITGAYRGVTSTYRVTVMKPSILPDLTVSAVLYDAGGNVITRPTNPQPFRLCGVVAQGAGGTVTSTKVRYAYQHSRGFSQQVEVVVNTQPFQACRTIEGLEIGEYVDVTLTVDPANTTVETNESNNVLTFRVTR